MNAKKQTMREQEALELAQHVNEIYVTKGKKVVHIDFKKERPEPASLAKLLLGPTGNLRAPTLRKGKVLVVGFDQETYRQLFGS